MWGISWFAENRLASQEGLRFVQVPGRCTFCGRQIFRKSLKNCCRPNCNMWAFEAVQCNERTVLVNVKIISEKLNKFIHMFLIYVMMQSVALSVERRMARRLMNSELKGSERKRPGISLKYYSVVSEGTEENLQSDQDTQFSCPGHNCRLPENDSKWQMCRSRI